jgi:hypothetical protein
MIHIIPKFGVLNFIKTIFLKLENWRIERQSSEECFAMDAHTMRDIGFYGSVGFVEATKRINDK